MQGDVRNVEAEMLNYLLGQIDAGDFKVNVIRAGGHCQLQLCI